MNTDRRKSKKNGSSILLEGRVTVSNNFTKRRQNGSKIGTRQVRHTFEVRKLYFK